MRISDWSSDVCSSDLLGRSAGGSIGTQRRCFSIKPIVARIERPRPTLARDRPLAASIHSQVGNTLPAHVRAKVVSCSNTRTAAGVISVTSRSSSVSCRPSARASLRTAFLRRSEEHTSELQSLMRISYAVFCLKKKKKKKSYDEHTLTYS